MRLKIPRILHGIWFGDELPEKLKFYRETWKISMPHWKQMLWTEDNLPRLRNQEEFDNAGTYAEKSDIARLELLERYGGIYADMDYSCQQSLHKFIWDTDFFVICDAPLWMWDNPKYRIPYLNNALMGCTPGHPLIKMLIKELPRSAKENKDYFLVMRTGPGFISEKLYGKDFLTLYNHELRRKYATHHYQGSWIKGVEKEKPWIPLKMYGRGYSTRTGKKESITYIKEHLPQDSEILDVGFGRGIYALLLREEGYKHIDGVDVYDKGIKELEIDKIYNNIYIEDIRKFNFDKYDLIILGDVLEHLTLTDAQKLLTTWIEGDKTDHLLISIPYELKQNPTENPYEKHLQDNITPKYMREHYPYLKLIFEDEMENMKDKRIGIYVWNREKDGVDMK